MQSYLWCFFAGRTNDKIIYTKSNLPLKERAYPEFISEGTKGIVTTFVQFYDNLSPQRAAGVARRIYNGKLNLILITKH